MLQNENKLNVKTPQFIGIGCPKCGSTWLQFLLASHPAIYIPKEKNEIHFFDHNFSKGVEWYLNFFSKSGTNQISGEITPHYLYLDNPGIVKETVQANKFIIIYRNPVSRAVSHYKFRMRVENYRKSFAEFITDYPESIEWGMCGKHLQKWLRYYSPESFLLIEYESAVKNVDAVKDAIANFLNIDSGLFPKDAGTAIINEGFVPKKGAMYKTFIIISTVMMKLGLYKLRNFIKEKIKPNKQFKKEQPGNVSIPDSELLKLNSVFEADQKLFNELLKTVSVVK